MVQAAALILAIGAYPLGRAWWACRRTSLVHALTWAFLAWAAWLGVVLAAAFGGDQGVSGRYLALCLTACAGVAVLGARRPGVGPWNLVVAGLLVVLLLPLAEGLGRLNLSGPRLVFLSGALAVGVLNYLPTRLCGAAGLVAIGCGLMLASLARGSGSPPAGAGCLAIAVAPWAGFAGLRWPGKIHSAFDQTWRRFRDRFGGLWAERLRQQFNRAADNAGLAAHLTWSGLRTAPADETAVLILLRALLRRFGAAGEVE